MKSVFHKLLVCESSEAIGLIQSLHVSVDTKDGDTPHIFAKIVVPGDDHCFYYAYWLLSLNNIKANLEIEIIKIVEIRKKM